MSWADGLRQYRPYALAVLAVVVSANIVPRPDGTGVDSTAVAPVSDFAETTTTADAAVSTVAVPTVALPTAAIETAAMETPEPRAPYVGAPAPQSAPTSTTAVAQDPSAAPTQLTIVASGYATGDVAVGDPEVPDDGLPVGAGAGEPSKISFVRLAGTATELRLALVADDGAHRLADLAGVTACPITEDWEPVRGQPMSEAPAYDCADGVASSRPDATTFAFDLSALPSSARARGVALVPGGDATGFYVTFSIHTLGES